MRNRRQKDSENLRRRKQRLIQRFGAAAVHQVMLDRLLIYVPWAINYDKIYKCGLNWADMAATVIGGAPPGSVWANLKPGTVELMNHLEERQDQEDSGEAELGYVPAEVKGQDLPIYKNGEIVFVSCDSDWWNTVYVARYKGAEQDALYNAILTQPQPTGEAVPAGAPRRSFVDDLDPSRIGYDENGVPYLIPVEGIDDTGRPSEREEPKPTLPTSLTDLFKT